jgi:hypothetical protein
MVSFLLPILVFSIKTLEFIVDDVKIGRRLVILVAHVVHVHKVSIYLPLLLLDCLDLILRQLSWLLLIYVKALVLSNMLSNLAS